MTDEKNQSLKIDETLKILNNNFNNNQFDEHNFDLSAKSTDTGRQFIRPRLNKI